MYRNFMNPKRQETKRAPSGSFLPTGRQVLFILISNRALASVFCGNRDKVTDRDGLDLAQKEVP